MGRFIFTYEGETSPRGPRKSVTVELDSFISLESVLEEFQNFLRASDFYFKEGQTLDIVDPEDSGISEPDDHWWQTDGPTEFQFDDKKFNGVREKDFGAVGAPDNLQPNPPRTNGGTMAGDNMTSPPINTETVTVSGVSGWQQPVFGGETTFSTGMDSYSDPMYGAVPHPRLEQVIKNIKIPTMEEQLRKIAENTTASGKYKKIGE